MVAFNVDVAVGRGVVMKVTVVPLSGYNLFLLSLLINLLLGHVAYNCHRISTRSLTKQQQEDEQYQQQDVVVHSYCDKEAVKDHIFKWCYVHYQDQSTKQEYTQKKTLQEASFQFTTSGNILIIILLILLMFLLLGGLFLLTYVFHIKGLAGYLLDQEDADDESKYSVTTTGTTMTTTRSDDHSNDIVILWIQSCFFLFTIVFPLLFLSSIMTIWMTPLSRSTLRGYIIVTEVVNAWNGIDVLVVSLVASLYEIEQFAEFIIGDSCDEINKLLEQCCDQQLHHNDKCIIVTASLLSNFWVLALSSCLLFVVGVVLLKISRNALNDRLLVDQDDNDDVKKYQEVGVSEYDDERDVDVKESVNNSLTKHQYSYSDWLCAYIVNILVMMNMIREQSS